MHRILVSAALCLILAACNAPREPAGDAAMDASEAPEMGSTQAQHASSLAEELFIDPDTVTAERAAFRTELQAWGRNKGGKRPLYERSMEVIGANGVLDVIEELWPKCHGEAHDAGKIIFARTQDIETGLRVCRDACYSGCMHGVLMEAFQGARDPDDPEGHIDPARLDGLMGSICSKNETMQQSYSPGDCAHAVGHALMVLAEYEVPNAVTLCDGFPEKPMAYYCATGAYMEYVNEMDPEDHAAGRSLFYPCDANRYPAACARYKAVHVVGRTVRDFKDVRRLVQECAGLPAVYRLGCIHGLGNGFMGHIAAGKVAIDDLCLLPSLTKDERFVCIEGAIERMAKYHPKRAREVCEKHLHGWEKEVCLTAAEHGMYNMEKDFSLYVKG